MNQHGGCNVKRAVYDLEIFEFFFIKLTLDKPLEKKDFVFKSYQSQPVV